ncbi:MaoC family dehydratase N-terminal domain-containing protein [Marinobacter sp. 71-i]|uniref:MaoC family dehydratase N-terminal domain-containing protein n=1 Tax=Marinobacter iranensis TaxID=2962607 RepID=A0ABT5Y7K2_9GAMM|nr:MaoC family dehydratase N-terminal domain-containing protein [Marinobacter iranensis]MDF0749656.1 MaoC family dehydratase N-terminal domain-containing protein [Marinobacter iranensis]
MSDAPENWIGKRETCVDALDSALAARIAAMLDRPMPGAGDELSPLWHWAFFQIPVPPSGTGHDGHIAPGGFLPKSDGNTRMWAGGRVEFHKPLVIGRSAERSSTIHSVNEKHGRSGKLLFVTVRHEYHQNGELCLSEEQDIVYKAPAAPRLSLDQPVPDAQWSNRITPSPLLLFRYSAVTFNGHRIHYDKPYTTQEEGYPDLVVQGPLIATLMVQAFTDANPDLTPVRLSYRGLRPLTVNKSFNVEGQIVGQGKAQLWAANEDGPAHQGEIEFKEKNQ